MGNDVPDDLVEDEHEQLDIPHVDVDELLRAIMPRHMPAEEIEETRERRRIELEEGWELVAIRIWVEEELNFRRLVRAYVSGVERFSRAALLQEEDAENRAAAKPLLARILNEWKHEFAASIRRSRRKATF